MKRKSQGRLLLLLLLLLAAAALLLYLRQDTPPDYQSDGLLRVCLDAGHGGDDPGAPDRDRTRFEKDDCLSMALAVETALRASHPEIEVLLTRTEDTYLKLDERCDMANDWRADLFVTIHRNSAQSDAQGVEIWIPSGKPAADKRLAQAIFDGLKAVGVSKARGVKGGTAANPTSDYYVLGHTDMPSCLIELGFMTNAEDNALLDQHHNAYAQAIADAIADTLLAQ